MRIPHRCHPGEGPLQTYEDALLEIYRKLRPGEPPRWTPAESLLNACSSTPGATTCPPWAAISSTRSWRWTRLVNQTLAAPVADPTTGEILPRPGDC